MTVIAIDFGTSNTVVSVWDPIARTPRTLGLEPISRKFNLGSDGIDVIPTQVFIQQNQDVLIGDVIRAQRLGMAYPERFFQSFKRDLVADFIPPARSIGGRLYGPEEVAAAFLQGVVQAVRQAGFQPNQVIMTVPVGSFEAYVNWLRKTATLLDLPTVQILDESTAAALGYAIDHPGSVVLVLDFGGGTLDLSLVKTVAPLASESVIKADVIAKSDAYVGGIDIDAWILDFLLNQLQVSKSTLSGVAQQTLLERAEQLKIQLSTTAVATETWFDDVTITAYELTLTRQDLEELLESQRLLDQVRAAIDEVLLMAQGKGLGKAQIDQVLLVGGTSQIPAIQQLVISYFGRQRVRTDKPFEAIAHGALQFSQSVKLQDSLRHSYAIRLWDPYAKVYTYHPLFEKGLNYPCQLTEALVLQVALDGQDEIRLDIGEVADRSQSEVAYDQWGRMTSRRLIQKTDFRSLSGSTEPVCLARLDPPGKAGVDRIQVQFAINENRMLMASVLDLKTQVLLVKESPVAQLV